MALLGLVLLGCGAWLIALGGSWYYAIVGLGFLVTAYFLWRRSPTALWVYALVTFGSLVWAVYEAGFDWWRLAPRGDIIVIVAIWLLMPWVTRELRDPERPRHASAFSWKHCRRARECTMIQAARDPRRVRMGRRFAVVVRYSDATRAG